MRPSLIASALIAVVAAGCTSPSQEPTGPFATSAASSGTHAPTITNEVSAVIEAADPPGAGGPLLHVDGLTLVDDSLGFLVGRRAPEARGGAIQRTLDGGKTWRTVWRDDRISVMWAGPVGDRIVALGARPSTGDHQAVFVLTSTDRGDSWAVHRSSLPNTSERLYLPGYVFESPAPSVIVGTGDVATAPCCGGPTMISLDAGAHWSELRIDGDPVARVDFEGEIGIAAIDHERARCSITLAKTWDAGLTWWPLHGCRSDVGAIQVLDGGTAYIGTGRWDSAMGRGTSTVWRTADGGATWRRQLATHGGVTIARLLLDAEGTGLVATGGCSSMGSEGPCVGPFIRVERGRIVDRTDVTGFPWTVSDSTVLAAPPYDHGDDGLARSTNGGRNWERIIRIDDISAWRLVAAASTVAIRTPLGAFVSSDGGTVWDRIAELPERDLDYTIRAPRSTDRVTLPAGRVLLPEDSCSVSPIAGGETTWILCGEQILLTSNGGATFDQIRLPVGAWFESLDAVSATEAWATMTLEYRLLHTTDGGRTWTYVWPDVAF